MKTKDSQKLIAGKSLKELTSFVFDKRKALKDFRFALAGSKTKNLKEGRAIRKDIARAMTAMNGKKHN